MTNEQIRAVALAKGFKLKEQPSGDMDLNPYVYDFARALIDEYIKESDVRNQKGSAEILVIAVIIALIILMLSICRGDWYLYRFLFG